MALRNGFSLIETLVAILIASLSAMALLQAVSTASRQSAHVIEHYERSLITGALIGSVQEKMYGQTLSGAEILQTRYSAIDDSDLLELLDTQTYTIEKLHEEQLDPMNSLSALSTGSNAMKLEEIGIRHESQERAERFYRLLGTGVLRLKRALP
jgi:prepilin-type N-terminal cleavage/methylation domain-containing protein